VKGSGDWPGKAVFAPLVFVEKQAGAIRISAVDEIAASLGLGAGLTLADARARVPTLEAIDHDRVADAILLVGIADDCERYTPKVEVDPPDAIVLDITGCTHLWGGEAALAGDLVGRLARKGISLRLALADTPDAALALARNGGEIMRVNRKLPGDGGTTLHEIPLGYAAMSGGRARRGDMVIEACLMMTEAQAIAALPVCALALGHDTHTAIGRAGLRTLGDLASRPRAPFAARFGADMPTRLARTLGEEDRPITPRRAPPELIAEQRFAEPIARTEDVLSTIAALAAQSADQLNERGGGGRRFGVSLFRSDGDVRRLSVETGAPTRDPALLMRLINERIDTLADPLDPGFGYDVIRLDVPVIEPLAPEQLQLERQSGGTEDIIALVDRLGTRLGSGRLRKFTPGDHHIPELASGEVAVIEAPPRFDWHMVEPGEPVLRPLYLFDPPYRVEVIAEIPDGPPRRFRWRQQLHDVTAHEGPERIASQWWTRQQGAGLTRDYYRVEDSEGRRFWLFRHGLYGDEKVNPDWYLHGVFT
jgi:protein ImuB